MFSVALMYNDMLSDYKKYMTLIKEQGREFQAFIKLAKELEFEFNAVRIVFPLNPSAEDLERLFDAEARSRALIDRAQKYSLRCAEYDKLISDRHDFIVEMPKKAITKKVEHQFFEIVMDKKPSAAIETFEAETEYEHDECEDLKAELAHWHGKGIGLV